MDKSKQGATEVVRTVNGVPTPDTDKLPTSAAVVVPMGFGVCSISIPQNAGVFEDKRTAGNKSTVLAVVTVPLGNGISAESRIYARFDAKSGEIIPGASLPKGLTAADENARAAFVEHAEMAVAKWNGYDAAMDAAEARLTNVKQPKPSGGTFAGLAPRLVKRQPLATQQPTA